MSTLDRRRADVPITSDDPGSDETGFSVTLSCPNCGGEVRVLSSDHAARCNFCASAHLVFGRSDQTVFMVPNQVVGRDEALKAIIEDWRRRRLIEMSIDQQGRESEPLDPIGAEASRLIFAGLSEILPRHLSPDSGLPEAILEADAAAWAEKISESTRVLSYVFFHAPYWHLSGRFYEAVIGRDQSGTKRAAAAVRGTEFSHNAFDDEIPVPGMGKLSYLRELRPMPLEGRELFVHLPITHARNILDNLVDRTMTARLVRELTPIVRRPAFWSDEFHLIFRPFHLVEIDSEEKSGFALLDGHSKSLAAFFTPPEAAKIRPVTGLDPGQSLGSGLALRTMRCPVCAGMLPLDRKGEIRFCNTCVRALRVEGEQLTELSYQIEIREAPPSQTIYLPFWRFDFSMKDPRDGRLITSLTQLRERLGGRPTVTIAKSRRSDRLDVPAFRPLDRRRASKVYQHLFAIERPPIERLTDGPARPEYGFSQPARFVSILEKEAAFTVREAMLMRLDEHDLASVSPARLRSFLLETPIATGAPQLILRAFRKTDVSPIAEPLGTLRN